MDESNTAPVDASTEPATAPLPVVGPEQGTEEEVVFTKKEQRKILLIREAFKHTNQEPPSDVNLVQIAEPTFEGTYRRRRHWISMTILVVLIPMLAGLWVVLFMLAGSIYSFVNYYAPGFPFQDWITGWIPLISLSVFSFIALWRVLPKIVRWLHDWVIVDDKQVILELNVPGVINNLIFNIQDSRETMYRKNVSNVKVEQSWLGELLGYGTVTLESNVQNDVAFHSMRFIRKPHELAELFDR